MGLDRLFEDQNVPPSSPIYWVLGALFLLLLLGALYTYLQAARRYANDRFRQRLFRRYAAAVASFSGLGAASVAFSLLAVPFLSKRLWLVLALLGLLGTAGYLVFYLRRRYQAALRTHEEHERRQRYLPRPKGSGPRPKSSARKKRGKRR
jgi:hypothetical protein